MLVDIDGEMPTIVATPSPRIEPVGEKAAPASEEKVEESVAETKAPEGTILKVVKKKKKKDGALSSKKPKKKGSSPSPAAE